MGGFRGRTEPKSSDGKKEKRETVSKKSEDTEVGHSLFLSLPKLRFETDIDRSVTEARS